MKRHFAPSLFALSLCALLGGARAADAQAAVATVPATIESPATPATPEMAPGARVSAPGDALPDLSPVVRPSRALYLNPDRSHEVAATALAPVQGRDWKMPTSRTLMIGGTAAALIGLVAIGGDAGAVVAMAGGGVAVYGLYLHYNR